MSDSTKAELKELFADNSQAHNIAWQVKSELSWLKDKVSELKTQIAVDGRAKDLVKIDSIAKSLASMTERLNETLRTQDHATNLASGQSRASQIASVCWQLGLLYLAACGIYHLISC